MIKNFKIYFKENLLLSIVFIWALLPFFAYSQIARFGALISFAIIILKNLNKKNAKIFFLFLFFIGYTFLINGLASNPSFLLRHLQLHIFLLFIFLSFVIYTFPENRKKGIFNIILFLNIIAIIGTILGLLINSSASRILAKSSEEAILLSEEGVGGYGLVYLNVLLFPILLYVRKKVQDKYERILVYSNIIGVILLIFLANFFIAILILLLQLLIFLIIRNSFSKIIIGLLSLFIVMLISYNYLDIIDKFTYPLVENTNLRYKHADVFNMLQSRSTEYNTIEGRSERYARSLKLFVESPLIGKLSFDDVGKHSSILDQFAQFGIVIGLLYINLNLIFPKLLLKSIKKNEKKYIIVFIISIILVGLFNNYGLTLGIAFIVAACSFPTNKITK